MALPVRKSLDEETILQKLTDESLDRKKRVFAARELAWVRRAKSRHRIRLSCLRVGPVSILHMPGELCVEYQLAAQKMVPGQFVLMAAYGDDGMGYICTEIAYSQGGYETTYVSPRGSQCRTGSDERYAGAFGSNAMKAYEGFAIQGKLRIPGDPVDSPPLAHYLQRLIGRIAGAAQQQEACRGHTFSWLRLVLRKVFEIR